LPPVTLSTALIASCQISRFSRELFSYIVFRRAYCVENQKLKCKVQNYGTPSLAGLIGDFFQSNTQVIVKFTEIGGKNE